MATLCVILLSLGGGLFLTIRHQISEQLDDSLRTATQEIARAAQIREDEAKASHGAVVDAVEELHIPDRQLYLLDTAGTPIQPADAPPWIRETARRAARSDSAESERDAASGKTLRLHAERITLKSGTPVVVAALADVVELEDRYASLIATFGVASLFALVMVAAGGSLLVSKSTAPVERTIAYMRRFMADAAHELRTPLTVLRSRAEVALQQPREAGAYVAALRGIDAESQRLGRIIDDLLTLARADTGERPIARERVFLDDLVADAADAVQAMAQTKGLSLTVDEFEEAVVRGDADLLRQLVVILLDNAVKFTPPGGAVRVRVAAPGQRAIVTVEDTGIGIPPEQLSHVFERFYRGDPARSRTSHQSPNGAVLPTGMLGANGAGLGLSIGRWIADAHGADIQLSSRPGEGTRVTIRFPSPDDAPTMPTSNAPDDGRATVPSIGMSSS
jgi:signal transduction histidine kinase